MIASSSEGAFESDSTTHSRLDADPLAGAKVSSKMSPSKGKAQAAEGAGARNTEQQHAADGADASDESTGDDAPVRTGASAPIADAGTAVPAERQLGDRTSSPIVVGVNADRPFKCSNCGSAFKLRHHLLRHVRGPRACYLKRQHEDPRARWEEIMPAVGVKPPEGVDGTAVETLAPQPPAGRTVTAADVPAADGDGEFRCTRCGRSFGQRHHLIRHMQSPYACAFHACSVRRGPAEGQKKAKGGVTGTAGKMANKKHDVRGGRKDLSGDSQGGMDPMMAHQMHAAQMALGGGGMRYDPTGHPFYPAPDRDWRSYPEWQGRPDAFGYGAGPYGVPMARPTMSAPYPVPGVDVGSPAPARAEGRGASSAGAPGAGRPPVGDPSTHPRLIHGGAQPSFPYGTMGAPSTPYPWPGDYVERGYAPQPTPGPLRGFPPGQPGDAEYARVMQHPHPYGVPRYYGAPSYRQQGAAAGYDQYSQYGGGQSVGAGPESAETASDGSAIGGAQPWPTAAPGVELGQR